MFSYEQFSCLNLQADKVDAVRFGLCVPHAGAEKRWQ
jgi:hypothetical protein